MNDRNEYLPSEGHKKAFSLAPANDPTALTAIRVREGVCENENISDGAARLFVRLLDLALNPYVNNGHKGQVIASQLALGTMLHCDERSIRRRVDELVRSNCIWTSLVAQAGSKPIRCYHITVFQPEKQTQQIVPGQGLIGNGKRRYDHGFSRTGNAAGQNRRLASGIVDRFGNQIFFNLAENGPDSGLSRPVREDKIDRSERTLASSHRGQNCPVTEDASVLSQRTVASGDSGQNCPVTADASVRHKRVSVGVREPKESKGEAPIPALDDFARKIKGMFPSGLMKLEAQLVREQDAARSMQTKRALAVRIAAIRRELLGDVPDDLEMPKARPARKAPEPAKELSAAELLESARYALELGTTLTEGQRAALVKSGELPKELWRASK